MARWTLRGLQEGAIYAVQGITIVMQNPNIRKQRFLKIFIYLSIVSFILLGLTNVLIAIPIHVVRFVLWFSASEKTARADDALESTNRFVREIVASVPFLALLFMRYIYPKPLDDLFMESLRFLDAQNPERDPYASVLAQQKFKKRYWVDMKDYTLRTWKKLRIGILLVILSWVPFVGRFVFPLAGAYTTYRALGKTQGIAVGVCFFFLPHWATMRLVRALIGMRSLMRELLAPYFIRMQMSHREKRGWFSGRKDVLFGFSAIAYIIIRLPIIGIVCYGIVQAASAYMLTVVTDPPAFFVLNSCQFFFLFYPLLFSFLLNEKGMGNMSSRENQDGKSVRTRSSISRFSSTGSLHTWSKSLDKRKKHKQSSASILKEQSSCSTLYEDSVHEIPLIEKYTDSQMTLLSNKSQQISQVDHITTISSTSTTSTHISENQADIIRDYSSQSMLKELYMLCETSPERRRDRDRRHRQHYLLKRTWGCNFKVPLHDPKLIIDWCCSSAVWDIEIALQFPNAKVIGIDYESATVSSITSTVKNFSFQNAMIHLGETGLKKFKDNQVDYIIMRDVYLVNSPVTKWISLFKEIHRILKPGGYIEIYEHDVTYKSIGPYFTIMEEWADRLYEAIKFDRNTNNQLGSFLQDTGYVNIQHEHKDLPIGEWPADKVLKETGYLQRDLTERKFREAKRWLCKFNGLSEQEYSRVLSKAIDECDDYNTSLRSLYFSAQKPA